MLANIKHILSSKNIRRKILFTILILVIYRFFIFTPIPFVNIDLLYHATTQSLGALQAFAMLMGGSLEKFSIVALGLIPFINASIILQLLTVVIPHLEELKEEGETGNIKIQQYTRWLTLPLAFLQSIGMVYLINSMLGGGIIDVSHFSNVLASAFVLTVGTILLVWLGELITERGISNGISLLIFASIVSGMTASFSTIISPVFSGKTINMSALLTVVIFVFVIVIGLIVLSILLIRTRKEIPITYARAGKIQETAVLPIPLNPVGMIPIIFAMAFVSAPYLIGQILTKIAPDSPGVQAVASFFTKYFNLMTPNPSWVSIAIYFVLIVVFTYFYSWVTFKPERMAEQIQKRGGYIEGIRPGEETAKYLNDVLNHLCFWGGIGLAFIGIYTYIIQSLPFVQSMVQSGGLEKVPVIVSGAGIIIIVGVVQEIANKLNADLLMEKYSKIV